MQIALARRLFSLPRAVLSCCAARCAAMPAAESNSVGKKRKMKTGPRKHPVSAVSVGLP